MRLAPLPHLRGVSLASLTLLAITPLLAHAARWKIGPSVIEPATRAQAQAVLTARDEFVAQLSPFDIAVRMKTNVPVTEQQFLRHVAEHTREWTPAEQVKLEQAVAALHPRLAGWNLPLPESILLVKLTGNVDGGAAYTRGDAIMLPEHTLDWRAERFERLLAHELFHLLSRRNPELRQKLYRIVGFEPCGEIEFPPQLKERKITNPDAPHNDYCVELTIDGAPVYVVPILYSSQPQYDPDKRGVLFDYLTFRLLVVERKAERWVPVLKEGEPVLLTPHATPAYFDRIGRNTQYIIHPEEVLADNFVLLLHPKDDVPTPRILEEMKTILGERGAPAP